MAMELLMLVVIFAPLAAHHLGAAGGLTCGILAGYEFYMIVHHAGHHWKPQPGSYLYQARLRHAAHHYSGKAVNCGVTTSFWDRVFQTNSEPRGRFTVSSDPISSAR